MKNVNLVLKESLPFKLETLQRTMANMAKTFIEHAPSLAERMAAQWRRDLFITMEIYRKMRYPSWENFFVTYREDLPLKEKKHQYLQSDVVHNYLRKKSLELENAEHRSVIHREANRGQ